MTRATAAESAHKLGPMPAAALMRTVDELIVRAEPATMFAIAADVERWPKHLPHYRYVKMRDSTADGRVVEMSANRPFGFLNWPTWWVSLMEIQERAGEGAPAIRFRHIGGITTRMDVEWSFRRVPQGTHVTILHLWNGPRWPLIGRIAARAVIGPVFVHGIASRTLAGLARAAEREQTSSRGKSIEE